MESIKWNCKTKLINNNIVWMCDKNDQREQTKVKENFESLDIAGVQLFTANNYGGTVDIFKPGRYNNNQLQNTGTKKLKSIKVGSGFEAVLYQNVDFTGYAVSITSDVPDLSTIKDNLNSNFSWNDQMQSMLVRKYVPPPTNLAQAQFTEVNLLSTENKDGLLATLPVVKISGIDPNSNQNILVSDFNEVPSFYWYRSSDLQFSDPFDLRKISDLQLWLDGSDSSSMRFNSNKVNTWLDKSGKNNNVTQSDPNFQPTLTKSFSNGLSAMNMGTQGYFRNMNIVIGAAPYSIFAVAIQNNSVNHQYIIGLPNDGRLFFGSRDGNFATFSGNGNWNDVNGNTPNISVKSLSVLGMTNEGTSNTLIPYFNGIAMDAKNGISGSQTGINIGAAFSNNSPSQYWNGTICEIIMYNKVVSKTERQAIEGYLAWKWGLQSKLPGHLYSSNPQTPFNLSSMGGLFLWLDGKDPLNNGSPPGNDSDMTTWNDKSGNGYNANCNGSIKYNSNFGPSFNGTYAQNCKIPIKFPNGDTPYSIFAVGQYIRGGTDGFLFETGGGANGYLAIRSQGSSTLITDWAGTWLNGRKTYTINKSFVFSTHYQTGGDMAQYFNGSMDVNIIKPNAHNIASNDIGLGTNQFPGYISEIIVFTRCLSFNERQKVEGYLATKWGLQSNLPNHPYFIKPPTKNPYDPSQISGLQLWLDGTDPLGNGIPPKNNSVLNTWVDKSENKRNAIGSNSPTFSNNRISFNGTNQFYTVPYSGIHQVETGFIVITFADGNGRTILMGDAGSSIRQICTYSNQIVFCNYNIGCPIAINPMPVAGNQVILEYSIDSNQTNFYLNGTQISNGAGFPIGIENNLLIGTVPNRDSWFNGKISEIIIYNKILSKNERQWVEGYLAWKWGLENKFEDPPFNINMLTNTKLLCWFDANDINGNKSTLANRTEIETWFDKSGNNLNAKKQNGGKPMVLANFLNGKTVLDLRGQTQFLVDFGQNTTDYTIFTVQYSKDGDWQRLIHGGKMDTDGKLYYGVRADNNAWTTIVNWGQFDTNQPEQRPINKWSMADLVMNISANTAKPSLNGIDQNTKSSLNGNINGIIIGAHYGYPGGNFWRGYVAEILVFNGVVNDQDRQIIQGYLAWKWGIASNLPDSHPSKNNLPSSHPYKKYFKQDYPYSILPPPYKLPFSVEMLTSTKLLSWFDGNDIYGDNNSLGTGSEIETWINKAGNGLDAKKVKNSSPKVLASMLNGKSVLDLLDNTYFEFSFGKTISNYTIFTVQFNKPNGNWQRLLSGGSRSSDNLPLWGLYPDNTWLAWLGSTDITAPLQISNYKWSMADVVQNSSENKTTVSFNGTNLNQKNSTNSFNGFVLGSHGGGGGQFWSGYVAEILIYDGVVNDQDRQNIQGYLAWKWDLAYNLPDSHPYKNSLPSSHPYFPLVPTEFNINLTTGLILWLDGTDPLLNGTPPANGARMTIWNDKSGKYYNSTSINGNPTYNSQLKAINFDGGSYFTFPPGSFPINNSPYSIFTVVSSANITAHQYYLNGGSGMGGRIIGSDGLGHSWSYCNCGAKSGDIWAKTDLPNNKLILISLLYDQTNRIINFNGVEKGRDQPGALTNFTNPNHIGGGQNQPPLQGNIYEVIILDNYNPIKNKQIENYLISKWKL